MSASGWLISCSTGSIVAESSWAAANFVRVVFTSSSCSGRDSSCRGSGFSASAIAIRSANAPQPPFGWTYPQRALSIIRW
ncbi:hypothetical protein PF004_g31572 [Phytophthora fragariae]|uniref:Uncharacterized protein n=1 Tax=Phytophthora fragariae TaxID=53985 RepID=A0A6G0M9V6_9STRA|nr:hypothetical protein PF004_g31572 [Phytophthora fragariae]